MSDTVATPMPTAAERYEVVRQALVLNRYRLQELETLAATAVLREREIAEMAILERQCANQSQQLDRLRTEMERTVNTTHIEAFLHAWPALMTQAAADDAAIIEAFGTLVSAIAQRKTTHGAATGLVQTLPRGLQQRLSWPSWAEALGQMRSALPADLQPLLLERPPTKGECQRLMQADKGCQDVTHTVRRFRHEVEAVSVGRSS
jgi:hypothetical protein